MQSTLSKRAHTIPETTVVATKPRQNVVSQRQSYKWGRDGIDQMAPMFWLYSATVRERWDALDSSRSQQRKNMYTTSQDSTRRYNTDIEPRRTTQYTYRIAMRVYTDEQHSQRLRRRDQDIGVITRAPHDGAHTIRAGRQSGLPCVRTTKPTRRRKRGNDNCTQALQQLRKNRLDARRRAAVLGVSQIREDAYARRWNDERTMLQAKERVRRGKQGESENENENENENKEDATQDPKEEVSRSGNRTAAARHVSCMTRARWASRIVR
ncbi:hypothetical protein BKA93DRAFT_751592 [Sparassis latifolia]